MSDTRVIEMQQATQSARVSWGERLSWCLPLVFVIGVPSVLITRLIFLHYFPDHFVNDSPTISETASRWPSDIFFEWTMALVTLFIIVSWSLNIVRNRRRLFHFARAGVPVKGPAILFALASALGIAAGLFLMLVAIFNLHDGHDVHMYGSWAFYISQALAITIDILFVLWLRRLVDEPSGRDGIVSRVLVAAGIFLGSWFFLYMYETKGLAAPDHKYAIQLVYVGSEYFVATMFLAYPMTAFAEMRRHFRELAGASGQE
ncbi:MAG: hypothetical protein J0G99_11000 [Alphaproteobacteria bacterium]|nr:hypothetical protein [Alphaproteobacteria bacterium]